MLQRNVNFNLSIEEELPDHPETVRRMPRDKLPLDGEDVYHKLDTCNTFPTLILVYVLCGYKQPSSQFGPPAHVPCK